MNIIALERQTVLNVKHKLQKATIKADLSYRSTLNCEALKIEVISTYLHEPFVVFPCDR